MSATASSASRFSNSRDRDTRGEKKFCGVCHKKGLPESVYTSHFTKSAPGDKGIVTCPTILNASCRVCGGKGHWADEKFCPAMKAEKRRNREYRPIDSVVATVKKPVSNLFEFLDADGEDDIVATVTKSVPPIATPIAGVSWAAMASRPAALVKPVEKPLAAGFVALGNGFKNVSNDRGREMERETFAKSIINERLQSVADSDLWYDEEDDYQDEGCSNFYYYAEENEFVERDFGRDAWD